jgi:hypothetical protein
MEDRQAELSLGWAPRRRGAATPPARAPQCAGEAPPQGHGESAACARLLDAVEQLA